jgi:hypothetical protein
MDIVMAAKLLNVANNGDALEIIKYVEELQNESNKIGVEFGKVAKDAEDKRTVANWGCNCERCKDRKVDSILHFDGGSWGVCRYCREDALRFFNEYMYPDKGTVAGERKPNVYNVGYEAGMEHGIELTKQQHGIKD